MFDVQHFVEEDIFYEPFGNFAAIEDLADRNRVMRGVMMPQNTSRPPLRPGQYRLFDRSVKMAPVESREDSFEIINLAVC